MSIRDRVLKRKLKPVEVPELDCVIHVAPMSCADLERLTSLQDDESRASFAACELIVMIARDENGERVFQDGDGEQLFEIVGHQDIQALSDRLAAAAGLHADAVDDAKKNSGPIPAAGS